MACRPYSLSGSLLLLLLVAVAGITPAVRAQGLSIASVEDVKKSASLVAKDLVALYPGDRPGETPGILPGPPTEHKGDYYWWQGGAMMGTLMDYYHYTGDGTYNDLVMRGTLHQAGENKDYMPRNFTASLGNDDQAFWGMTVMLAAEIRFPDPPKDQPQWLALAQAVWATQADPSRHDQECGGGMRWQVPFSNAGYDYKNTIANGCFFNMGARLARYTNNNTYAEHAERTWNWLERVKYIEEFPPSGNGSGPFYRVYDGANVQTGCTNINRVTFSYNAAVLAQGTAFMYNHTRDARWRDRTDRLLEGIALLFFKDGVAFEISCEEVVPTPAGPRSSCSTDMLSFKGYLHRWLAVVAQVAPHTAPRIFPLLRSSTAAAARQCTGGDTGRQCGFQWHSGKFVSPAEVNPVRATTGAGEQMNVLAALSSYLVTEKGFSARPPVTADTGGTSKGSPNGGFGGGDNGQRVFKKITTADRVGATFITIVICSMVIFIFMWISLTV